MTTAPSSRFVELDGLRGIAALAVVVGHLLVTYDTYFPGTEPASLQFRYGAFGVQLFFLISGFVILMTARRQSSVSGFAVARFARLYPTYWIALAGTVMITLLWAESPERVTLTGVLANLTMVQRWFLIDGIDPVSWTLAIEMQFYILIGLLLWATRSRLTTRVVLLVMSTWLVVSLAVSVVAAPHSHGIPPEAVARTWKIILNVTLAEYGPLFASGCLMFLARTREVSWLWPVGGTVVATACATLLHSARYGAVVGGLCALMLIVTVRASTSPLRVAPVRWLGRVSFSLYIFHTALGYFLVHTFTPRLGRDAAVVVALLSLFLCAEALHRVGEVTATRALRNAMQRRWQSPPPSGNVGLGR